jgi:hypothetical protein
MFRPSLRAFFFMKKQISELISLLKKESTQLLILFSVILLVFEFFGWQRPFHDLFRSEAFYRGLSINQRHFYAQAYTTINFLVWFVCLPLIFHIFVPAKEVDAYGLKYDKNKVSLGVYLLIAAFMVPVTFIASTSPNFYKFYPLYQPTAAGDWLTFEAIYMVQFFCVEYFFRGFGLYRLEKLVGEHAVALMTLPYALLHIHKPFPEAIGSIFAGLVLGHLSLKGRSIWPGVVLHMLIALSADTFGLYHRGWF